MPTHNKALQQAKTPSRKINLARKRLLAATSSKVSTWYICKQQSGIMYYLADFDDDNNTAMWCRRKDNAQTFKTEIGVYQYVSTYLGSRTDITLLESVGH